jgi:uncharacterized membrane protein YphA (DoxX/SURF4 family)
MVRDDRGVNPQVRAWIGTLFRVALAVILFWSGFAKLLDHDESRQAIIGYRLPGVSGVMIDLLAWGLPAFEILLAILLLVGLFTRWAALGTALLMMGFVIGIASVWIRGYNIECGCFGGGGEALTEDDKVWRYSSAMLRDFLFTGMAVWLVAWPRTMLSLDGGPRPALDDVDPDDEPDDPNDSTTDTHAETLEEPTR